MSRSSKHDRNRRIARALGLEVNRPKAEPRRDPKISREEGKHLYPRVGNVEHPLAPLTRSHQKAARLLKNIEMPAPLFNEWCKWPQASRDLLIDEFARPLSDKEIETTIFHMRKIKSSGLHQRRYGLQE